MVESANIPGATNALPGVFTDVITQGSGAAIPGGSRVVAMIGQGSTNETLITQAAGGGQDGLNPTYTSSSGADGRHFALSNFPLVSNRSTIFKNGVPLVGTEGVISTTTTFNNKYDYLIDITTGHILLQSAYLVDQGSSANPFYSKVSTNVGDGYLSGLDILDDNAPPETWTIRCVAVQRNAMNQPVANTAKFLAFGSVSGAQLDANGNPIVWMANGQTVSNGILTFAIFETTPVFREGDGFTIIVSSGVLVRGDSLTSNVIPVVNINLPTLTQGMGDVINFCGSPSLTNNLSLGAQLAYANNASSLIAVQAAPPLPRRTSYVLDLEVNSLAPDQDEFIFPLPVGVVPDFNTDIHFFVTNPTTQVETQILPNKFPFYTLDTGGNPTTNTFIFDDTPAPAGHSYFYSVNESLESLNFGEDGYIGRDLGFHNKGLFSSPSVSFDSTYVGKALKIFETTNSANFGVFNVTSVINGKLYVVADGTTFAPSTLTANPTWLSDFINVVTPITSFQVINPATGLQVGSFAGTDGYVTTTGAGTGTATLASASVDFNTIPNILTYRIQINGPSNGTASRPVGNNGLYDIVSTSTGHVLIRKAIVNESGLEFEVLDPASTSLTNYVVINHNVVPNGNQLRVSVVDARDASFYDAGWINALASLETIECDILVPLPNQTISVIFQNSLSHCITMSNIKNKKERVLFIGAIQGLKPANLTGASPAAVENIGILEGIQGATITDVLSGNIEDLTNYSVPDGFGQTYRAVYFFPDQIVVQAGTDNILIDGLYLAAAAAGYENADLNLANPLTNKVLSGFTILRNKLYSSLILEQLAQAGVTTLQPVAGGGRIVWGITTSQSGFVEESEISIVFIRDRVAKVLRAGFAGFIGTPSALNTGPVLNTTAVLLLNSLIAQGLITAYKDLNVMQDSVDPTQWDISVRVQPNYPINFIYIKVTVGQLASG